MKKCISLVLAIIFVISLFQVNCFADETGNAEGNTEITIAETDYSVYLEANNAIKDAPEGTKIVIAADSYDSFAAVDSGKNGAVVNHAEHTDEVGKKVENVIEWTGEDGVVNYTFEVEKAGMYEIQLSYCPKAGRGLPLRFSFAIDGTVPYSALGAVNFARTFVDENPEGVKGGSNIYASEQIEKLMFKDLKAMETSGQYVDPLKVALTAGTHTLSVTVLSGECYISAITFTAPDVVKPYAEVKQEYAKYEKYTGAEIYLEGEKATYKSSSSMNPLIDNSDPSLTGIDGSRGKAFDSIVNYAGGTGWQKPNETLTWEVTAPKAGLYKVAFRFRQNVVISGNSYRSLKVNGKSPFAEAESIPFYYNGNWQFSELKADNGETALIYLEEGVNTLSLAVTLADFGEVSNRINAVTYEVGGIYLNIRMITGETVDTGRSYEFFKNIPNFNETLQKNIKELESIRAQVIEITKEESGTYVATIDNMIRVMKEMYDNPYTAQKYITSYYDSYTSLCALVTDIAKLPLDLDQVILAAPDAEYQYQMANWWDKTVYGFKRFVVSFMNDYKYDSADGKRVLTIWVTWGRDQTQILTSLVKDTFEAKNQDIHVEIKIVGASLIQAILAGSGPDLLIGQPRTEPVNYGMRGALLPLSDFDDYEKVMEKFQYRDLNENGKYDTGEPRADDPYKLNGVSYGIPDTQSFSIMFYRTDILNDMGLEPPETWDEFKEAAALFQRQNLAVGLPSGATTVNTYATRLLQKGLPVYTENQRTNFLTAAAVETFVEWTEYYTDLGFLKAYDFYNRFRAGTIPIGVADYAQYTLFSQAAPEIVGKWDISLMPGTPVVDSNGNPVYDENGKQLVNHTQADSGTSCVIPRISKNANDAWKFLQWWTDANTQYRYSVMIEAILGDTGRRATANREAFQMLSWESDDLNILLDAWGQVTPLQEVPGGYYVDRSVMQAFQNVINMAENPKDMIFKWAKIADAEIDRKRGEYGLE